MAKVSAAVRFDRDSPTLVISNRSRVEDAEARRVTAAIQTQVDRDFFPLWGWRARLVFRGREAGGRHAPHGAMHLIRRNASPDAYAGYHFIDGLPEAEASTRDANGPLADWQDTLSPAAPELTDDPGATPSARGRLKHRGRLRAALVAYEVCDPVQADSYRIDGVPVSDFVTPEWFEPEREPGSLKFSFRDSVTRPFELADGGYIDAYIGGELV